MSSGAERLEFVQDRYDGPNQWMGCYCSMRFANDIHCIEGIGFLQVLPVT